MEKFQDNNDRSQEKMIPVNGREQLLEMLRVADDAFREHILKLVERRDPRLARDLRRELY